MLRGTPEPKTITLLRTGKYLSSKQQAGERAIAVPADLRSDMDDVISVQF